MLGCRRTRLHLRGCLIAAAIGTLFASAASAQEAALETRSPSQLQDTTFDRLVHTWTTKPEFLSPLVDHLPLVAGVPSPKDVLGYYIGAPKKLTRYADILRYYRALAAASPRVKVIPIGTTDEGRECVVVFIGSAASITALDHEREDLAKLADPRGLTEEQARAVIADAKPLYHLMGGLHSGETAPPEMLMELAYRLATEDSPLVRRIRDNVIVSITPVAEPDGRDRYVDWYYRYLVDVTDESDRIPGPPYWGKYVFHDNNRDINYSQKTMRNLLRWYLRWHPPIMHDLHESIPFLYDYSGAAPQNPNYDPILFGELPWYANWEMAQMTKFGMPGVWTHAFMDAWSPGYLGSMSYNHNGMMRMYEIFGNGGATTMERDLSRGGGRGDASREWYRPLPPYKKVLWSMRNGVNYSETAVLLGLELTSRFPKVVLQNFYLKSRHSIDNGETEAPPGWVLPADQRDMTRVALLVNLLRTQGIEVGRATKEVKIDKAKYPKGSYIIKRNQPYGRLAHILLERQAYPDSSVSTYDDSGWTMGLMLQTEVDPIDDKAILDVPVTPVDSVAAEGRVTGKKTPKVYAVAHFGSNNMITLRYRLRGLEVRAAEKAFEVEKVSMPAGSFLVVLPDSIPDAAERVREAVEDLGLTAVGLSSVPDVPTHELDMPRIAMFSTWGSTQDVGWVRYAFDRFAIPYDLIFKERIRQGDLRASYDVIVVPSQGRNAKSIVMGIKPRKEPIAYTKTPEYPNLGMYGSSPDITGGMGLEGLVELQKFVQAGGLLVTLGNASTVPPEFGLTRDIGASRPARPFYAPRPIVDAAIVHRESPIFYGYADSIVPIKYANGPLLQVPRDEKADEVLMEYVGGGKSVLSGVMRSAGQIEGRPAIVDVPVGSGRVMLYATNPVYRWQNHDEFNMLFNALLNWDDLAVAPKAKAEAGKKSVPKKGAS